MPEEESRALQAAAGERGLEVIAIGPDVDINATTSLQKVDRIERNSTDPAEATAFNSPTAKAERARA